MSFEIHFQYIFLICTFLNGNFERGPKLNDFYIRAQFVAERRRSVIPNSTRYVSAAFRLWPSFAPASAVQQPPLVAF